MWSDVPCNVWTGPLTDKGYGREDREYRFGKRIRHAHVVAWIDANGCLPPKELPYILHHCDIRPCIEPIHLYAGTQQDNMNDMIERGRKNSPSGDSHWKSILQSEKEEIRKKYATGNYFQYEIAKEYGISLISVNRIINNRAH